MKNQFISSLIIFMVSLSFVQSLHCEPLINTADGTVKKAKLSPITQKLIMDMKNPNVQFSKKSEILGNKKYHNKNGYILTNLKEGLFAGGLLKINNNEIEKNLLGLGVKINTKAGNIWSVKIPIENIESVSQFGGIDYIQVDEPVRKRLDSARAAVKADFVRKGIDLPKGYSGKNVIVGIVDNGFDYTNPAYYDTTGNINRILRVWDQTGSGYPPSGFSYGTEYTGADIISARADANDESHATHVSGIAGGSGLGTDGKYMGMAPGCDFVLVPVAYDTSSDPFETGQSCIIDGISYIFNYAKSVNKPAVVNLSLGEHIGPHDGTSLFDQACDALIGPGKIIVGSAGNEGNLALHIAHTFSQTDTVISSLADAFLYGGVDIWGEPGNDFCFKLYYYNINSSLISDSTDYFCTSDNVTLTQISLNDFNGDGHQISISTSHSEYNNEPRGSFEFSDFSSGYIFLIKVRSTKGTINMWNFSNYAMIGFSSNQIPGLIDGDTKCTVGEIGGTGKNIITAGAYTSKHDYMSIDGQPYSTDNPNGEIASFSSLGPTADGRMKPDVTAPGSALVSAINSFDMTTTPSGYNWGEVVFETNYNSKTWYYAAYEGTSMSCPSVVGTIALWLEANPTLTPSQIKDIIKNTAIKDSYTGNIGIDGNNEWGWGKINAWDGMKWVLTHTSINDSKSVMGNTLIYPNPNDGNFHIFSNNIKGDKCNLEIYDIFGKTVYSDIINVTNESIEKDINLNNLSSGFYIVKIRDGEQFIVNKIQIVK